MKFEEHVFEFPNDYDGKVVATLVSHRIASVRAVLYVHGYTDYFFQEHLAEWFTEQGFSFYAVDLRKYGRSLLEGQHPNFCRSITEYYPDITESLRRISRDGHTEIVLMGHSTGGLLASLYADNGQERGLISKLVLNSPFFEFNTVPFKRHIVIPIASLLSRIFPFLHSKPELSPYYAQSVHKEYHGEWDFNKAWKPIDGFPLYFSWLAAVRHAQHKLQQGLHINAPVLVICSASSYSSSEWNSGYMSSDGVLNVEHIARFAMGLGRDVELVRMDGGMHDIFLSAKPVRERAFEALASFIV